MELPKGEIVRFLVCLGMYSISKRCSLILFSGLRIEDSSVKERLGHNSCKMPVSKRNVLHRSTKVY